MLPSAAVGPGLSQLLSAQRREDALIASPQLELYAQALVDTCRRIGGQPVVWPTSRASERLAGAASLLGGRAFRVRGSCGDVSGERVVVVAVTALTPLPLLTAAHHASALGAREVFAAGVEIDGLGEGAPDVFVSYVRLQPTVAKRRSA